MISPTDIFDAIDGTWPAAQLFSKGPWTLREGRGGGKRVSAATASGPVHHSDIVVAEEAMRKLGQRPLFMVRSGEKDLDEMLAAQNYMTVDSTSSYVIATSMLTDTLIPSVTTFAVWEPLEIMAEIWAKGGLGPARLDVMKRAKTKVGILARWNEKPAGAAFVALQGKIAMVHAVEVLPFQRRQGVAQWMMRRAAFWAGDKDAETLAVLCTDANRPAIQLYQELGFHKLCGYHYRLHPEDT